MSFDAAETAVLRALGSPVRQAILDRLARGASTGAELARALDSNTGVMSYHLRELASAGLVERDETRGRAQFWRLARTDVRFGDPGRSTDPKAARSVIDARLGSLAAAVERYLGRDDLDDRWRDAALFSQSALQLTVDELAAFATAYLKLLRRSSGERSPAGQSGAPPPRPVRINLFAFPDDPDDPDRSNDSTRTDDREQP
jgi:DNA-binding transcriptional ArsR family regulator